MADCWLWTDDDDVAYDVVVTSPSTSCDDVGVTSSLVDCCDVTITQGMLLRGSSPDSWRFYRLLTFPPEISEYQK